MKRHSSDFDGIAGRCEGLQLRGPGFAFGTFLRDRCVFHARGYTFWHKSVALRAPMSALGNRCI